MPKPPFAVPAVAEPAAAGIDAAELGRAPEGAGVAAEAEPAPKGFDVTAETAAAPEARGVAAEAAPAPGDDAIAKPEPAPAAAAEGDPVFEAICAFIAATAAGLTAAAGVAGMIRELRVPSASSEESAAPPALAGPVPPAVAGAPARAGAAASPGWASP
jgi:hypothetical protein